MNPHERHDFGSTDEELEVLLENFFRQEIPRELPPLPGPPRASRERGRTWRVVAAAASLLVVCGASYWLFRGHQAATSRGAATIVSPTSSAGPLYTVTTHELEDSAETPIELKWKTIDLVEPTSGDQLALEIPEVTIELPGTTVSIAALSDSEVIVCGDP